MQTFLPYKDFTQSLSQLDNKRLGKQRVETKYILELLMQRTDKKGYANHPIVHMWKGYESALQEYFNINSEIWLKKGFRHTMGYEIIQEKITYPSWLGNDLFHISHKANLLKKDKRYYSKFDWGKVNDIPYVWLDPSKDQWFYINPTSKKRNYININRGT